MRKGECLISTDVQADRGARNQPTEEDIDDVQDQETTAAASEDRPDEQGENVVQQAEGDDEDHAEGEEARQEK
jgi:hypothetical protein